MSAVAQEFRHRGLITGSIMLAAIMQVLDMTIANVALPHIQSSVSATQDEITWVITSYLVASTIMTPLTGWLAGTIGRKRVFLYSVAGFSLASGLCGMATTLDQVVIFRLLQGMCGAALMPLSQTVLLDINPPERYARAMVIWSMGTIFAPITGPLIGGYLTDHYSWRWIFYINLPFGIMAFLGLLFFLPESKFDRTRSFDFFGFTMLALAIGALQLMLDRGEGRDWFNSTEIWFEMIISGLCTYLFIVHTATAKKSFLNRAMLRDRNFVVSTIFGIAVGMVFFAPMTLMPVMMQNLLQYPVMTAGLITAPRGAGMMIGMLCIGRLLNYLNIRFILLTGIVFCVVSLWMATCMSLDMDSSLLIWSGVFHGLGIGLIFIPMMTIAFATLKPDLRMEGASFFTVIRNIGSSASIAITSALVVQMTQVLHSNMAEHVRLDNPLAHMPFVPPQFDMYSLPGLAAINAEITRQAAMIAYIDAYWLIMLLTLIAAPLVFLMRSPRYDKAAPSTVHAME